MRALIPALVFLLAGCEIRMLPIPVRIVGDDRPAATVAPAVVVTPEPVEEEPFYPGAKPSPKPSPKPSSTPSAPPGGVYSPPATSSAN